MIQQKQRIQGFSLMSALFLLVVVTLLGGYMVNMNLSQQAGTALTLQSVRAWYAAKGGVEWALFQINAGGCPTIPTNYVVDGFSVQISRCDVYPISEGGSNYNIYDVESRAWSGSAGGIGHVQRTVRATMSD